MATPSGARHRDTEQRLLDLETGVRNLTAASLRRRQLSVTEGDFVVSGGGGVVIEDGGALQVKYDSGTDFLLAQEVVPGWFLFSVNDANNTALLSAAHNLNTDAISVAIGNAVGRPAIAAWGNTVLLDTDAGTFITHATTGSAANCRIETNGLILRVSSSRRYKTDVQDASIDPAQVLQLEGRTWVAREDEGNPDAPRYVGFIAEELHDLGLTEFVEYDDEGRPDAIQYDRLSVGMLAVAKSQQKQLDALSARLDALESAR
jgi:hypothetical protein